MQIACQWRTSRRPSESLCRLIRSALATLSDQDVSLGGGLVGIVTDRDLRQVPFVPVSSGRALPVGLPVERIMTAAVISVQSEADIFEAARLMHEQKIGALPVVENGRLVGILTEIDLLRALAEMSRRPA